MNSPTDTPWVIRTDFSSDHEWAHIRELIAAPQKEAGSEFFAYVRFVDDDNYRSKEPSDLVPSLPDDYPAMFCFIVDDECIQNPEHPVLVVGFYPSNDEPNEAYYRRPRDTPPGDITMFRALPSRIQSIENNLSIGNMDFEEFAESVEDDGVFRGFPQQ